MDRKRARQIPGTLPKNPASPSHPSAANPSALVRSANHPQPPLHPPRRKGLRPRPLRPMDPLRPMTPRPSTRPAQFPFPPGFADIRKGRRLTWRDPIFGSARGACGHPRLFASAGASTPRPTPRSRGPKWPPGHGTRPSTQCVKLLLRRSPGSRLRRLRIPPFPSAALELAARCYFPVSRVRRVRRGGVEKDIRVKEALDLHTCAPGKACIQGRDRSHSAAPPSARAVCAPPHRPILPQAPAPSAPSAPPASARSRSCRARLDEINRRAGARRSRFTVSKIHAILEIHSQNPG